MTETVSVDKSDAPADRPSMPSRRPLVFALIFLMASFSILTAYRYAVGTVTMDWYLYQIARQTSWLLDLTGNSCHVENPDALRGHEDEMASVLGPKDSTTSFTPWEAWRYRSLTTRRDLATVLNLIVAVDASESAPSAAVELRLSERVQALESVINRLAISGGDSLQIQRFRQALMQVKASLTAPDAAGAVDTQRVESNEAGLKELAAALDAYLKERENQLLARMRDSGPRVYFVAKEATESAPKRSFVFEIVADCGAVPSMAIYLSAILAFPTTWRRRLVGVVIGLPLLHVINIVRLACLGHIGAWFGQGDGFDFAHHYLWQAIYIVFVVVIWLLWVELVANRRPSWAKSTG